MPKPTKENPLVFDHPGDALNACADVLAYMREMDMRHRVNEETENESAGRYWILQCVEDSLRYWTDHAEPKQQKVRAVS